VPPPPSPRTPEGAAGLTALVQDPSGAVIGLDFDGTLAPIVPRPEDARPAPGAIDALVRLAGLVAGVVVLTGRPAETAVALSGLDLVPGLQRVTVLGQYGAERWDAATGAFTPATVPPGIERARRELSGLITDKRIPKGVEVEDKGVSLAVHLRRTNDDVATTRALRPLLEQLAARTGLVIEPGRKVLELRAPGVDKGSALRGFVAEVAARAVMFAGDDLGDLAAFAAVRELRGQGVPGLTVCAVSDEVEALRDEADMLVDGATGTVELLQTLASVMRRV
jgi:trehalose 6-phosphate phosphatase